MATRRDIVVTWPKTKSLRAYLEVLAFAQVNGEQINYRVARPPSKTMLYDPERGQPARCYRVYDGKVRGYTEIVSICRRSETEVRRVESTGGYWPAGWYVVCSPVWHEVVPYPMGGFRGWRYYDYLEHMCTVNVG